MDEDEIKRLKEEFDSALKLREEADSIEESVAHRVGNEVYEWLDLGKKTEALKLINNFYGKQGGERNQFWYAHFQTIIFKHM